MKSNPYWNHFHDRDQVFAFFCGVFFIYYLVVIWLKFLNYKELENNFNMKNLFKASI